MNNEDERLRMALKDWEARMAEFSLPSWGELPDIELYMDQVVTFLTQRLGPYLREKPMTASTINNYVRIGAMPAPKKKRYTRLHLAFLVMICTLRHSMSIADISKIVHASISKEELEALYGRYVRQHRDATRFFIDHLQPLILPSAAVVPGELGGLAASSAVFCALSKMLAEQLLTLHHEGPAEP